MSRLNNCQAPESVQQLLIPNERAQDVECQTHLNRPHCFACRPRRRLTQYLQRQVDKCVPVRLLARSLTPKWYWQQLYDG